jgi:hypothetical protein
VVEIPCPPDCQFLKSGQAYHWLKQYMAMLQAVEDPSKRQRLFETSQKLPELLVRIEEVIVSYSAGLTSLTDREVKEAVESVKSTYQTEQKGVIYEHTSSNPLVQALVEELRTFLEEYRKEATEQGSSIRLGDLLACLEFVEVEVGHHLAAEGGPSAYLQFIARSHPEIISETDQGGIILAP